MTEKAANTDNLKLGFGVWLTLCFLVCVWFLTSFTKGRRQFQSNLSVIEDGLKKMQKEVEETEGTCDDDEKDDDLDAFLEKFQKDEESREKDIYESFEERQTRKILELGTDLDELDRFLEKFQQEEDEREQYMKKRSEDRAQRRANVRAVEENENKKNELVEEKEKPPESPVKKIVDNGEPKKEV
ncbi:unnamed protein product [Acanthoscelides obtectus]|uniref:Uncharacterized protein n=1 Tax=Acanthoscelides obtectus TaxID=200917 RepID=A0A9P0LEE3_ACAOB|nr:unnamed protein product [Acanthoscelides obtectus]CAH2015404.1 unnamed protein product [Acanthoscelides obtectus]CAK1684031.1 hypothetical protein AOBTE_LOCUS34587 [Acanthoscelides obtectus]CAK1684579.1 hypothetical protein AOBTE_LOCUS34944 [Acanthoscelides obtectus]